MNRRHVAADKYGTSVSIYPSGKDGEDVEGVMGFTEANVASSSSLPPPPPPVSVLGSLRTERGLLALLTVSLVIATAATVVFYRHLPPPSSVFTANLLPPLNILPGLGVGGDND